MLVLWVEAEELRQPEVGIAVAQHLGTHGAVETGLAGHLGIHSGGIGRQFVEQTLCRGVFFFLIQIHGLAVKLPHGIVRRRLLSKNRHCRQCQHSNN